MAYRPTGVSKFVGILLIVVIVVFGGRYALNNGWIPGLKTVASTTLERAALPEKSSARPAPISTSVPLVLPGNQPTSPVGKTLIRTKNWAWNTQAGWFYANGGPVTTEGSLMAKHGIFMTIERQDDTNILRDELFACAKQLSDGGTDCTKGIHFTAVMGDQLAAQLAAWNPMFAKLGADLVIEAIALGGASFGEDTYLAPPAVKSNPQSARGTTVICALREGDQNIVIYWAAQNGIPLNPDPRTYDPDAINFMAAESYTKASEMYNAGACEDRPVVKNGKRTGERHKTCGDSEATWTPGDVTATVGPNARGGLVRIWSTKENSTQMPNTILGIKRWNATHRDAVVGMVSAILEGGAQVKTHREALRKSMEISATLYKEETPDYWYRYFVGVEEFDKQGNKVQLGGSTVFDLSDNLLFFGMESGQANLFKASYETFGGWMMKLYPTDIKAIAPYSEAVNLTYLQEVQRATPATTASTVVPQFREGERITEIGARRAWAIEFESGSANFTPAAQRTLDELFSALIIAQSTMVEVHGHTDSTGTIDGNQTLSERRAFAVKAYLEGRSSVNFPQGRVRTFAHGQTQPIVPNDSVANLAKNRRVEVVIGR